MLTLVVGGAASGKSAYAEALVLRSAAARRIYLATMSAGGEEARRRIEKHRAMRGAGKGFETVECPVDVSSVTLPPDSAVSILLCAALSKGTLFECERRKTPSERLLCKIPVTVFDILSVSLEFRTAKRYMHASAVTLHADGQRHRFKFVFLRHQKVAHDVRSGFARKREAGLGMIFLLMRPFDIDGAYLT